MFSPLGEVEEFAVLDLGLDTPGLPALPEELEPVDYRILTLLFQGRTPEAIAGEVGRPRSEVLARTERPRFTHLRSQIEKGIVEAIARGGEYEPITIARVSASPAMRRIIALSKTARDPRVYLAANKEVLRFAGAEPPRKVELVTPDKVLDEMTPEELAHFAATREWPTRFRDKLAQYIKYEGGEVTVTRQQSITFSHPEVKAARTDTPDEADIPQHDEGVAGLGKPQGKAIPAQQEPDETIVFPGKQIALPFKP